MAENSLDIFSKIANVLLIHNITMYITSVLLKYVNSLFVSAVCFAVFIAREQAECHFEKR